MKLEEELETTLFIRDRAGLRLTEAAEALVRYGRAKNLMESEFLAGLKGGSPAGVIRIGGFSSVMQSVVLPGLAPLLNAHSGLKLQMVVDEMDNLPARLRRGEIDYMILDRRKQREELERIALGKEQNVLVQKRGYKGPNVFLDHDEHDPTTRDYLRSAGEKTKDLERRYLDNIYGVIEGVRLGLGRAVVAKHLIAHERSFEILNPRMTLEVPVSLYFYAQPFYPKMHQRVVDHIVEGAKRLLAF
jgi:DNA-binding transcriptional LysR family regulator